MTSNKTNYKYSLVNTMDQRNSTTLLMDDDKSDSDQLRFKNSNENIFSYKSIHSYNSIFKYSNVNSLHKLEAQSVFAG